jgi:hypothetical protein
MVEEAIGSAVAVRVLRDGGISELTTVLDELRT